MVQENTRKQSKTNSLLAPSLKMGVTELNVHNMQIMDQYYSEIVGLEKLEVTDSSILLGYGERSIVRLVASHGKPSPSGSAGLYHNAIVFSSRGELARTIKRVLEKAPQSYSGTADHLVSEAFYFTDPEGNGLELYFDKDPVTWQWQDGKIIMDSIYIDPVGYIQKFQAVQEQPEKHMGHVHLKVGNIEEAHKFYVDILGFDETASLGSALFVSVAGYHHHLGMNTWESAGAGKREPSLGLKTFTVLLPDETSLEQLKKRLLQNSIQFDEEGSGIQFDDPWNNRIVVTKG